MKVIMSRHYNEYLYVYNPFKEKSYKKFYYNGDKLARDYNCVANNRCLTAYNVLNIFDLTLLQDMKLNLFDNKRFFYYTREKKSAE